MGTDQERNKQPLAEEPDIVFAGNDYLGLARHPGLVQAATKALEKYGVNFFASRQTTGSSAVHVELENLLATFKDQQDALVFASGYLGNKLLLDALRDRYDLIFADALAHPSILEGIPRDCPVQFYHHCAADHLEELLNKNDKDRPLVITDGIFALTGEISPLDELYQLVMRHDGLLIVDDAHATGVLGKTGKGTPEHFHLNGAPNLFQSETMSKALGAYGGFIATSAELVKKIRTKSLFYGASTALPPPLAAAGCASVKLICEHPEFRERLLRNAAYLREGIRELGYCSTDGITPIIPVFFDDEQNAKELSGFLKENHIITPAVHYPLKLEHFLVRITVTANHSTEQIDRLLFLLKQWRNNKNI